MVRICSAQVAGVWQNPGRNLERAEACVREAGLAGASLISFPEQFAGGWSPLAPPRAEDIRGGTVAAFRKMAEEHGIAILAGFIEKHHPMPRNTAVAIDSSGEVVATYAKMHLFSPAGEDRHYTPGDDLAAFTVGGVKFGIALCYDLRFSPLFRIYALHGVCCVLVPAAWPCSRRDHWEILIRARALDNQMYVSGINATGTTPVDTYCGNSLTADPEGGVCASGGSGECMCYSEIERSRLREIRSRIPVEKDRRSELHHRLSGRYLSEGDPC